MISAYDWAGYLLQVSLSVKGEIRFFLLENTSQEEFFECVLDLYKTTVTSVINVTPLTSDVYDLLSERQKACGVGYVVVDGEIE